MRKIGSKYWINGKITKNDGTEIPQSEPLFLFRAKDKLLLDVLAFYRKLRIKNDSSDENMNMLDEQMELVKVWQEKNFTQFPK